VSGEQLLTDGDMLVELQGSLLAAGSAAELARRLEYPASVISEVLNKHRAMPESLANALGFVRVYRYRAARPSSDRGTVETGMGMLEFEGGRLVKVGGQRPQYMDGYQLIRLVQDLGAMLFRCCAKAPAWPEVTLAFAREMAAHDMPLPEDFYIDTDGNVQRKPGRSAAPDLSSGEPA